MTERNARTSPPGRELVDRNGVVGRVRVLIIDDHTLFARGLEMLLGVASTGRIDVVGIAGTVEEATSLLASTAPDLALVDLTLPAPGGVQLIRTATAVSPGTAVLALTEDDNVDTATDALAAGARGLLPKSARPEELLAPMMSVYQGWRVCPPSVLEHLLTQHRPAVASSCLDGLGPSHQSLLTLVARGLETADIAERLFVSQRTAKRMVAELRERLGAKSRIEMAVLAARAGLLDDEEPARG